MPPAPPPPAAPPTPQGSLEAALQAPLQAALAAVAARPADPEAWAALADAFSAAGSAAGALEAADRAVRLDPRRALSWTALARARRVAEDPPGTAAAAREALARDPADAGAWTLLGLAALAMGAVDGAVAAQKAACARAPRDPAVISNLATALSAAGDDPAALGLLDAALRVDPADPRLRTNRALTLLSMGDFARGFPAHEARLERPGLPALPGPAWGGGPLTGALVVAGEQGLGDVLQWARFLPRLRGRVPAVWLAAPPRLHRLLRPLVDGVWPLADLLQGALPPGAAAVTPLLSLPARLGEAGPTLAEGLPLWRPDPAGVERWRARLGPGRWAGVAWQGNPAYARDALRSPPLSALAPLGRVPGLRLCSLQKGHGLDALRAGALGAPCLDLDAELDPGPDAFIDTLDLMGALDVIITSDTATAHLAGGAGLPAHLLLSRPADWRWGQDGERSPWYPSLRLWRQPRPGAWGPLLERLAAALA